MPVDATETPIDSMGVTTNLDWLTWTVPYSEDKRAGLPRDFAMTEASDHPTGPIRPYNNARRYGPVSVYWSPKNPHWKLCYVMTGSDLTAFRNDGGNERALLFHIYALGAKITRLDVAVDILGDERADVLQVAQSFERGWCTTQVQKISQVHEQDSDGKRKGATVYLGSRQSNRMLRVYDKAAQLDHPSPWVRVEMECKQEYARKVGNALILFGMFAAQVEIAGLVETGIPWFDDAMMVEEHIDPVVVGRKQTSFDVWVMTAALPNVIKAIRMGNHEVAGKLRIEIDKLRGDGLYW